MRKRKNDGIDLVDEIGVLLSVVVAIIALTINHYQKTEAAEQPKSTVIYLTEEEMMNRPLMPTQKAQIKPKFEAVVEHKAPVEEVREKYTANENVPLDTYLQLYAQQLCEEYKVGYAFFLAMCESESSFNTEAVGDSGRSRGLMQINKPNWEKYGLDASMTYDNLEIGIRMMSELIEKYGEFDAVVMAYKGGESKADEWIREGFRLSACDEIAERTIYWQEVIEKEPHSEQ